MSKQKKNYKGKRGQTRWNAQWMRETGKSHKPRHVMHQISQSKELFTGPWKITF